MTKRDYSYLNDPVLDALVGGDGFLKTKDDWWQNDGHRGASAKTACLMLALGGKADLSEELAQEAARFYGFAGYRAAAKWNDAPERTFAEVKALQKKAIEARLRFHNIVVVLPQTEHALAQAKGEQP